jgi:hypothetical protein
MPKSLRLPTLILTVLAVAGCGSSHARGFRSATHHYSVRQVKSAFAAHGISLTEHRLSSRDVLLQAGARPHFVNVSVLKARVQLPPLKRGSNFREARRGNVVVDYSPSEAAPVKAALAELH